MKNMTYLLEFQTYGDKDGPRGRVLRGPRIKNVILPKLDTGNLLASPKPTEYPTTPEISGPPAEKN